MALNDPPKPKSKALCGQFWSDLGLEYQHAYGNDAPLVKAVQHWLSLLPSRASVLECGCGTGIPIGRTIADGGYRYHGIDLASGMVDICKKQVPEGTYEVVSMLEYNPKDLYDGIVASLSHFELTPKEHVELARKCFQWTKPGGYLLISTIVFGGVQELESYDPEMECADGVRNPFMGHEIVVTLFTKVGWRKLLEGAGFEIVHTEDDLFVPKAKDTPDEPRYYITAKKPSRP
ncbi:MAG: hypothetical protein Q9218_003764 [Villophora microphyllina]